MADALAPFLTAEEREALGMHADAARGTTGSRAPPMTEKKTFDPQSDPAYPRLAPPLPPRTTPLNVDDEIEAFHTNWHKNLAEDAEQLAKGKKNFPKGEHVLEDIADDKHLED